jgi:RimJ/RimL family protein N-acetyltransferase
MFIRTKRLFLRPVWAEDAAAIEAAVAHWDIVKNLSRAPWPYGRADAEAFAAACDRAPGAATFLIFARTDAHPALVGSIGFERCDREPDHEIGYWIAKDHWGRGYATEAGRAVLELAFDGLHLPRLAAAHFIDNPASGSVLRKLGFTETGEILPIPCRARGGDIDAVGHVLTRNRWLARRGCALRALAA